MSKVSEPDCYETPDVPVVTGVLKDSRQPDTPESKEIDNSSLPSSELFERFSGKQLDTSRQNYDRVQIGNVLKQSEYSFNPSGRNSESALERYQRLRVEIEGLANDLKSVEQESPDLELEQGNKASDISKQLMGLQNILDQCESSLHRSGNLGTTQSTNIANQLIQELQGPSDHPKDGANRITYELYCAPNASGTETKQLAAIEKRIASLESGVGSTKEIQKPIAATLALLEEKISLLDENKLSIIETKIASLSDSLEKSASRGTNEKVDNLFDLMNQWDSTSQQVPIIIERLVSLKGVHEQGISAVNSIHQLQKDQTSVTDLLNSTAASFQRLETAFEDNKKIINNNVASLEERMAKIEQKLS